MNLIILYDECMWKVGLPLRLVYLQKLLAASFALLPFAFATQTWCPTLLQWFSMSLAIAKATREVSSM